MKICRFKLENETTIQTGILDGEFITPFEKQFFFNLAELALVAAAQNAPQIPFAAVKFLPPVVPSKIVCVGRNYAAHAAELGNELPSEPLLFLKAPTSMITEGESIMLPPQSKQVEHEGELAVILKRTAKNLHPTEDPFDYVLGYACLNDVTARDLQRRDVQFTRAKSFDTFCPIGNFIETELNPQSLAMTVRVNGAVKQSGNTQNMVFNVPALIRYISEQMTLLPGDIIATGTPSGVSALANGDLCTIEIEGLGVLSNPVQN